jgi:DNA-binding beta-propeller fold protein YncE
VTLTLLIACGPGRDSAVVRAAALQHITGSARLVAGGGGAAPQRMEWEASVAVAAVPVGDQVRATLTFPAHDRPALAGRTGRVQVNLACRGEAVAGMPLMFWTGVLTFGAGGGRRVAGCFEECNAVAVDAKLNRVYVADGANTRVVMFDASTGRFVRSFGEGLLPHLCCELAVHPTTGELWVLDFAHRGGGLPGQRTPPDEYIILVLDPESGVVKRRVRPSGLHECNFDACTFNADGSVLYLSAVGKATSDRFIAVVRTADELLTNKLGSWSWTGSRPAGLCVDAAGDVVVACNDNGKHIISVRRWSTGQEVRRITEAEYSWTRVASHNGKLYAVADNRNDVSVIDAGSTTVSSGITTSADGQPLSMPRAVTVHDGCLLVACNGTGRVHVLPLSHHASCTAGLPSMPEPTCRGAAGGRAPCAAVLENLCSACRVPSRR